MKLEMKEDSLALSRMGLGTVQFGFAYGVNNSRGQVPFDEVCQILEKAAGRGINFLDTSRMYGASEQVLGRAMEQLDAGFVVCTKLDLPADFKEMDEPALKAAVRESFEKSRESLRLDKIPVYLLHNFDYYTAGRGCVWEQVKEIQEEGGIGMLGVSIGRGPEEARICLEDRDVRMLQIPFNVLDQRWKRAGILDRCSEKGIHLVNRSTYLQGLLLKDPGDAGRIVPQSERRITRLREIAQLAGIPVKELVYRYVLGSSFIGTTIVGVDTPQQLQENLELWDRGPLSPETVRIIEESFSDSPDELVNPALWNIAYSPPEEEGKGSGQ